MSDKTFKINPGEELDIFIRRRKETPSSGASKPKRRGVIEPFRFNDVLPRRLTKQGGIQFFDLGQILLEGIWTDFAFAADANIHQSGNNIIQDDISPTDYAAKHTAILGINLDNFLDKFKRIQKSNANKFYLRVRSVALNTYYTLDADSTRWTSDGKSAKFEDSELAQGININTSPFFSFMRIGQNAHPDTAKITTEPDYDGDEVEFTVGKNDVYFLVPAFCSISNFETGIYYPTTDRADIFVDSIQYTFVETLYANYLTFPRILMDSLLADWFAVNFNLNKTLSNVTLATYNLFYQNSEFLKGKAGTRFFKLYQGRHDNGTGGTSPLNVTEEKVLADYPFASIYPAPPLEPHYEFKDDDASVQIEPDQYLASWGATSNSGSLLAIIKQGDDWFYAWER